MQVQVLKTAKIEPGNQSLWEVLDTALSHFEEGSVLAITSKIVSICQGRVVPMAGTQKSQLITQEAQYFIPPDKSKYGITLTIKDNVLIPTAGIDESNSHGYFVLWPADVQNTTNQIRAYLQKRFQISRCGVVITDSTTTPLRRGTRGMALAHSGFLSLHNYIDQPDIFDRPLKVTQSNLMDGLAATAVLLMGEGNEQTPLAVLSDLPFITFQATDPSPQELAQLRISLEDDLYTPLLENAPWQTGYLP